MTIYYVRPTVGNDTNGGTTWAADSWTSLKKAADTVGAGDVVIMDTANADVITADTTYAFADGVQVISSANGTSYTAGATVSSTTNGADVVIEGTCALFGVTISLGDSTDVNIITLAYTTGDQQNFSGCTFAFGGSSNSSGIILGTSGGDKESVATFESCSFSWAGTGQGISVYTRGIFINCDMSSGETHPTTIFEAINVNGAAELYGCDLSDIATVFVAGAAVQFVGTLSQCKLKASSTVFAPAAFGRGEAYVYDCSDDDKHFKIAHYSYLGSTTVSESVYASDNIADTNLSWVVAGSAAATKCTPYLSPWMSVYNTGTSEITPYLEVLRSGSTTSYLESEAWIEVLAKTTSGSTKSTLYTNHAAPLDTTTDNADSAKGAGDWTGEDASNNWYGKLILNAAITPAEVGHIRARVGVAGEYTLYVDPQIRGLA